MALERLYEPLTESGYYILLCLSLGDSYGYEIMNRVQELSGGLVTIGPGTMYGALSNMIRKGWIFEAGHKGKRRIYRLAKQGGGGSGPGSTKAGNDGFVCTRHPGHV